VDAGTEVVSRGQEERGPRKFLRLMNLVVILVSVVGLAWLVVTQHEELGRPSPGWAMRG
jgi:hypothetical protein